MKRLITTAAITALGVAALVACSKPKPAPAPAPTAAQKQAAAKQFEEAYATAHQARVAAAQCWWAKADEPAQPHPSGQPGIVIPHCPAERNAAMEAKVAAVLLRLRLHSKRLLSTQATSEIVNRYPIDKISRWYHDQEMQETGSKSLNEELTFWPVPKTSSPSDEVAR